MGKEEILQKIGAIMTDFYKLENFVCHENIAVGDVEAWNSFSHLPLMQKIEESFSVRFSFMEITDFNTLGDIADCIHLKLSVF